MYQNLLIILYALIYFLQRDTIWKFVEQRDINYREIRRQILCNTSEI